MRLIFSSSLVGKEEQLQQLFKYSEGDQKQQSNEETK